MSGAEEDENDVAAVMNGNGEGSRSSAPAPQPQPPQPRPPDIEIQKYKVVFVGDERVGKTSILRRFMDDAAPSLREYDATIGVDYLTKHVAFLGAAARSSSRTTTSKRRHGDDDGDENDDSTGAEEGGKGGSSSSVDSSSSSPPVSPRELMMELGMTDNIDTIPESHPPISVRLQLWDTAGSNRFRDMIPQYLRDCNVAVVVYDVTSRRSFHHAATEWIPMALEESEASTSSATATAAAPILFLVAHKVDALSQNRAVSSKQGRELAARYYPRCHYVECSSLAAYNVRALFRKIAAALYVDAVLPNYREK